MGKNIDKSLQQISLSESKTKTHMGRLYEPKSFLTYFLLLYVLSMIVELYD